MSIKETKVALILSDNFDANEFSVLHSCLMNTGFLISVVSEKENVNLISWDKNVEVLSEVSYNEARSYDFDAAIVSGRFAPDVIRTIDSALAFIRDIYDENKLVCAIDHGAQAFISAGFLNGKNVTGPESIKTDLENAKARYLDEPVVVDNNIITGRSMDEINEFCDTIIREISGTQKQKMKEEAA